MGVGIDLRCAKEYNPLAERSPEVTSKADLRRGQKVLKCNKMWPELGFG